MSEQEKEQEKLQTEEESISKIRDILFGNNISEIDKRFHEQDALFRQQIEKTVDEFQEKVTHIQEHFQKEINALNKQLKTEREKNKRIQDQLFGKIDEIWTDITEFKEETDENNREIRKTQLEQFNQLNSKQDKTEKALKDTLEKNTRQLTEAKVDRKALALMFSELALNLNNDGEPTA